MVSGNYLKDLQCKFYIVSSSIIFEIIWNHSKALDNTWNTEKIQLICKRLQGTGSSSAESDLVWIFPTLVGLPWGSSKSHSLLISSSQSSVLIWWFTKTQTL